MRTGSSSTIWSSATATAPTAHRRFYDEYNAVLDMAAEYYLDTIKVVFQDFALPKGNWHVRGTRVEPSAIRGAALMTVEGELDDISGNGQTEAAHILCTQDSLREAQAPAGQGRGPLRDLQRAQVPRADLPADPRLHQALGRLALRLEPQPLNRRGAEAQSRRARHRFVGASCRRERRCVRACDAVWASTLGRSHAASR